MSRDEIYEKIGQWEIFTDDAQQEDIIWYLLHLLGGKIVISTDPKFWDDNLPKDRRIVLRKEDGQLVLVAEQLNWS